MADSGGDSIRHVDLDSTWAPGFVELYQSRWAPMVRLARLLTAADPAAEELVQDAFLRVHAHWDSVDSPPAYLRTAVVNACRNHQRRGVLERRHWLPMSSSTDEPDELRDAIAALPSRQRTALVLRYYEDLPEREISEVLGCSVTAVKSLLHRAMEDLRKVIDR